MDESISDKQLKRKISPSVLERSVSVREISLTPELEAKIHNLVEECVQKFMEKKELVTISRTAKFVPEVIDVFLKKASNIEEIREAYLVSDRDEINFYTILEVEDYTSLRKIAELEIEISRNFQETDINLVPISSKDELPQGCRLILKSLV